MAHPAVQFEEFNKGTLYGGEGGMQGNPEARCGLEMSAEQPCPAAGGGGRSGEGALCRGHCPLSCPAGGPCPWAQPKAGGLRRRWLWFRLEFPGQSGWRPGQGGTKGRICSGWKEIVRLTWNKLKVEVHTQALLWFSFFKFLEDILKNFFRIFRIQIYSSNLSFPTPHQTALLTFLELLKDK